MKYLVMITNASLSIIVWPREITRGAYDNQLEDVFVQNVSGNYANCTEEALVQATAGAKQCGTEMK